MIFVTIGSLFPFDRLIRIVDELAPKFRSEEFFAQIGDGAYEPHNIGFARWLDRVEFKAKIREASVIVAHAGMGSVITAMENKKPIVLVPRVLEWGEHTTDHQMATARWLEGRPGIFVCMTDTDLPAAIGRALAGEGAEGGAMSSVAPDGFVQRIRSYIASA